jgi:Holliday junction resolvase RusA-like endonuclease
MNQKSLTEKVNLLAQQSCNICAATFPISTVYLRIKPQSYQASNRAKKKAFKSALLHRLSENNFKIEGRVCLSIVFACSTYRKAKDLDNMAKLLMDSIKGIVMEDDKNVDHLNLVRIDNEGEEEFITFRISASNINNHDDVIDPKFNHSWGGAEPLRLEDFLE